MQETCVLLDASQRRQRARIAALSQHASGRTNTGPARAAFANRFRQQAIADAAARGVTLTEPEIARRAELLRRLFYTRMAFASVKARQARAKRAAPAREPAA